MNADHIYGVAVCPDCGEELEVHCRHGHDPRPVQVVGSVERAARDGMGSAPAGPKATKPMHRCGRCGVEIPPKPGRPAKYCERCLTPAELQQRQWKRESLARTQQRGRA